GRLQDPGLDPRELLLRLLQLLPRVVGRLLPETQLTLHAADLSGDVGGGCGGLGRPGRLLTAGGGARPGRSVGGAARPPRDGSAWRSLAARLLGRTHTPRDRPARHSLAARLLGRTHTPRDRPARHSLTARLLGRTRTPRDRAPWCRLGARGHMHLLVVVRRL